MFVLLRAVVADAHRPYKKMYMWDDVGIAPYKCGALEVKPFLIRSFYWLRERNEPSKETEG